MQEAQDRQCSARGVGCLKLTVFSVPNKMTGSPEKVVVTTGEDANMVSPFAPANTAHLGSSRVMSRHQNTGTLLSPMGDSLPTNRTEQERGRSGRDNKGLPNDRVHTV